jgi:hypothetical protein
VLDFRSGSFEPVGEGLGEGLSDLVFRDLRSTKVKVVDRSACIRSERGKERKRDRAYGNVVVSRIRARQPMIDVVNASQNPSVVLGIEWEVRGNVSYGLIEYKLDRVRDRPTLTSFNVILFSGSFVNIRFSRSPSSLASQLSFFPGFLPPVLNPSLPISSGTSKSSVGITPNSINSLGASNGTRAKSRQ